MSKTNNAEATRMKWIFTNYFYPSLSAISVLSLFHCFILQYSFAQTPKIDSLQNILKTAKEDTTKIITLNALAWQLSYTNPDTSIILSKQAFALSGKIKWKTGIGQSYHNLGWFNTLKGNYTAALDYDFKALAIWKKLFPPWGENRGAATLGNIGSVYRTQADYPKALDYYFKALKMLEELGNKNGIAIWLGNIGSVYLIQADYPKALDYFLRSLKMDEELGNKNEIAADLGNIGVIYNNQADYLKALNYYFKALKMMEELGNKNGIAILLGNIGNVYNEQKDYPKALDYYFKALKMLEELGNKNGIASYLGNIGNVYLYQADYSKALDYYFRALKMKEELGDKHGITIWLNNIGSLCLKQNKIAEAKKQSLASLSIAKEIGAKEDIKRAYQLLSLCDSATGNWKGAYEYHQLYSEIKDSIFNEESSKQIAEMSTKYETEKKEQQIKLLEKEGELQKSEVRRQKFIIWSVAGGLLIVVVFSFFIFKERKKSEKLLLNILPVETARELKKKGKALPKHYELVTVLFTDFKGFTKIAEKMSVEELVSELDFVFRKFDEIISKYPIEKIKTIGDAYMCAGGLPVANTTNPMDVVLAALDIKQFVEDYKQQCIKEGKLFFEIRIGVHTGTVVAGVVGDKKFAYDIWGDTVNTASRMESSGEPGKVNISGETYGLLQNTEFKIKNTELQFQYRGEVEAKNKGKIKMYFVEKNHLII